MIYYFSGTGNTRECARMLARRTGDGLSEFGVAVLRQPSAAHIQIPDKRFILMTPVYSWGLPPVVMDILRKSTFEFGPDTEAWLVVTCGDDIGETADSWRSTVRDIGFRPMSAFSIQMPNTYVSMKGFDVDSKEIESHKIAAMTGRIEKIARAICDGKANADDVVRGKWAWLKTHLVHPWFVRNKMSAEPFYADESCIGCGLCINSCPMENIVAVKGNKPSWRSDCAGCLRCYHICPRHAIQYGTQTAGKGQYTRFIHPDKKD